MSAKDRDSHIEYGGAPTQNATADEERMREILDETEFDSDLGVELARDAQRLVAGELSEAEFHERHHEAVVEEFGVDERPLEVIADAVDEAGGDRRGLIETLEDLDFDEDESRRDVLKKSGAVAGGLSLGVWGTTEEYGGDDPTDDGVATVADVEDEFEDDPDDVQMGMVIDLERCDGCLGCVSACREDNNWSRGANWMYVFAYEEDGREDEDFLVRPCMHCSNPPCAKVCPVEARHKRTKDGLVLTDYDICIGCRYCQVSCPYGVNYFQWGDPGSIVDEMDQDHRYDERGRHVDGVPLKGTMGKCTFCPTRQDDPETRGSVACMEACDDMGMHVIHFGNLNDPESRPRRYLRQRREAARGNRPNVDGDEEWATTSTKQDDVSTFRLLEDMGTQPNVIYIGDEPGPTATQVDGPVSYEAQGTVDRRKDVLDQGAGADVSENHVSTHGGHGSGHAHGSSHGDGDENGGDHG